MIHVNLIEAANRSANASSAVVKPIRVIKTSASSEAKKKSNFATIAAAAGFVLVAGVCSMFVFGLPSFLEGVIPNSVLDAVGIEHATSASSAELASKRAAADAKAKAAKSVTGIVGEVNPGIFPAKTERTLYKDYLPLEKMQYQKATFGQLIAFLQTATPENTGFANIVYEAPNYFYIRGASDAPVSQRAFMERLRSVSLDLKAPEVPANENALDIDAVGTLRMENVDVSKGGYAFVKADSVNAELQKFKALDGAAKLTFNGIEKPKVEDFGVYKRYSYKVRFLTNFVQFSKFVAAWKESDVRMGVNNAVLERSGKDVAITLSLDMFVTP